MAALIGGCFMGAAEASAAETDLSVVASRRLEQCVLTVAAKLEPSGATASEIADAAIADELCALDIIALRYAPQGGPQLTRMAIEDARGKAINAIVKKRAMRKK